jgi:hypothetical protein
LRREIFHNRSMVASTGKLRSADSG